MRLYKIRNCEKIRVSDGVWAYYGVFGDGRFNGTMQNVVGLTLVATATKFELGTEIQSHTANCYLLVLDSVCSNKQKNASSLLPLDSTERYLAW